MESVFAPLSLADAAASAKFLDVLVLAKTARDTASVTLEMESAFASQGGTVPAASSQTALASPIAVVKACASRMLTRQSASIASKASQVLHARILA